MYTLVPSFFQPSAAISSGEDNVSRENELVGSQCPLLVGNEHANDETLPNVDLNVSILPSPSFWETGNNAPLFDLDFGFEGLSNNLNVSYTENDFHPSGYELDFQPFPMDTSFGTSSIEAYSRNVNTTRYLHPKTLSNTEPKQHSKRANPRYIYESIRFHCPDPNCISTFARRGDLTRHQRSLHSPKTPCTYSLIGCSYATGRPDKMKEHMRKRHHAGNQVACTGEP